MLKSADTAPNIKKRSKNNESKNKNQNRGFKNIMENCFPFLKRRNLRGITSVGSLDIQFVLIVFVLLVTGLLMMYSASYSSAIDETIKLFGDANPQYYIFKQLKFAIAGSILMLIVSKINTDVFKDFSSLALIFSIILLVLVLLHPYVIPGKEQFKRWLNIGFVFQPSEIAKLGVIMFLAWSIEKHKKQIHSNSFIIIPYIVLIAFVCLLIYEENHLSATILVFGISMIILFLGGFKMRSFVTLGIIGVVGLLVLSLVKPDFIEGYMMSRIESWLDKDAGALTDRWQTNQSLYAIGSGGLFGVGFNNSTHKYGYIPEPQNDFVFSIVGEELGFFRACLIIILFVLLVWRGYVIASRAKDTFSQLLTMGIVSHIGIQAALNIAVVTDFIPNTGISLPFFSYGGTSLVILLIEVGMVMSVSRSSNIKKR